MKSKRRVFAMIIGGSMLCSTLLASRRLVHLEGWLNPFCLLATISILLHYTFSLAASIGLLMFRRWGFITMYVSFLLRLGAMVFMWKPIAYVPFIHKAHPLGQFVINTLIFGILIAIHVIEEKSTRFERTQANKASEATSEPAPGAASSSPQG